MTATLRDRIVKQHNSYCRMNGRYIIRYKLFHKPRRSRLGVIQITRMSEPIYKTTRGTRKRRLLSPARTIEPMHESHYEIYKRISSITGRLFECVCQL